MEILELEIEKLVFEGLGLGHTDGKVVFVKGAIPNDIVKIKIVSKNKNFLKGEIIEIIKPSKNRVKPVCPLAKPCGGCDLSFVDYDFQVLSKENIIKEIFSKFNKTAVLPIIKSPKNLSYRHKTQYPVCETKKSKRVVAGYFKENSHEIVNIKFCPIQPSITDEIVQFVRDNWKSGCYIEKNHKGCLRHINTKISSYSEEVLLTLVINGEVTPEINSFALKIMEKFPKIKGVLANINKDKTNKITGEKTVLLNGEDYLIEKLKSSNGNVFSYKIGSNSFFQINPHCASLLFDAAKKFIKKGTLLDLYGGVGTIGIFMSDTATKITLVEENKEAIQFAKENYKLNNVLKYEVFEGQVSSIIKTFIKEKRDFENIIIDPPRKGSDKETLNAVSKMTNSIIYISCNPMTLKRDSEILINNGFNFKSIQPVDMFPQTHHIECVAHFEREIL